MSLRTGIMYNQYRGNTRVSGPATEPVTLAEVKSQLRLDASDTSEDALINLYIESARSLCEELFGLALITQVWKLTLDRWPGGKEPWWDGVRQGAMNELSSSSRHAEVYLPRYPLQSVDSMNVDGSAVTVGDVFIVDAQQKPGRLVLKFGESLPSISDQSANAIQITYTSGYGDAASDVPADIRLALLQMVATLYSHRGDECSSEDAMRMSGAYDVLKRYKAAQL